MERPPLEQIRAQHFELGRLIRALEKAFAALASECEDEARSRHVLALLEDLDRALPEHFALEERGGYFFEVVEVAPRLRPRAERLQRSHVEFREQSRAVLELARSAVGAPDKWERWKQLTAEFLKRLRQHEADENELVREAFRDDLPTHGSL